MSPDDELKNVKKAAVAHFLRIRKYLENSGIERGADAPTTLTRLNSTHEREPRRIGDVLENFAAQANLVAPLAVTGLSMRWSDIVGEEVAEHVMIDEFDDATGVLKLATDSTAWATQMRMLLPTLLIRIADEVGPNVVTEIVVNPPKSPSWKFGRRSVPGRGPRDTYG